MDVNIWKGNTDILSHSLQQKYTKCIARKYIKKTYNRDLKWFIEYEFYY
jgi:hypothetical protein